MGKSLLELNLRTRYKINVIAIRANGKINPVPHAEDVIREGDALFVLGPTAGIQELERFDGVNAAALIWDAVERKLAARG